MTNEAAEIIAAAIKAAGASIGTGDAATTMGGLELLAMEIKAGSERIAEALEELAEATGNQ